MGASVSALAVGAVVIAILYAKGQDEINSSLSDALFPRDYYFHEVVMKGYTRVKRECEGCDARMFKRFIQKLIEFLSK